MAAEPFCCPHARFRKRLKMPTRRRPILGDGTPSLPFPGKTGLHGVFTPVNEDSREVLLVADDPVVALLLPKLRPRRPAPALNLSGHRALDSLEQPAQFVPLKGTDDDVAVIRHEGIRSEVIPDPVKFRQRRRKDFDMGALPEHATAEPFIQPAIHPARKLPGILLPLDLPAPFRVPCFPVPPQPAEFIEPDLRQGIRLPERDDIRRPLLPPMRKVAMGNRHRCLRIKTVKAGRCGEIPHGGKLGSIAGLGKSGMRRGRLDIPVRPNHSMAAKVELGTGHDIVGSAFGLARHWSLRFAFGNRSSLRSDSCLAGNGSITVGQKCPTYGPPRYPGARCAMAAKVELGKTENGGRPDSSAWAARQSRSYGRLPAPFTLG